MAEKGTVVVVGSGAAGRSCARSLAGSGWRVVLAEKDRWGGTCLWRGCIPKKSLYHSASVARALRAGEQFGAGCATPLIDWQTVLGWKWHAQESYAGDQRELLTQAGIELAEGPARFVSEGEIEIGDTRHAFDHAVVATGSAPVLPSVPGAELADTSEDALRFRELPRSLLIVGGGFIALEMAGIFASFGVPVTVATRGDRVLDMLDAELGETAHRRLQTLGVGFVAGASLASISGDPGDLTARFTDGGGVEVALSADRVLLATGRRPAVTDLGLESAGVELDARGTLVVDAYLRTTNPAIWAAGDAAGGLMQTPVAALEGRTVASSIDTGHAQHPDCSAVPITCFTLPQLATVGITEAAATSAGRPVKVHRTPLSDIGAAVIADETDGFVKLVCDAADETVLGMQAAGPVAGDIIYSGALAVQAGLTAADIRKTVGVHPSFGEAVYYAGW